MTVLPVLWMALYFHNHNEAYMQRSGHNSSGVWLFELRTGAKSAICDFLVHNTLTRRSNSTVSQFLVYN